MIVCTSKIKRLLLSPIFKHNNYLNKCWIKIFKDNIALALG